MSKVWKGQREQGGRVTPRDGSAGSRPNPLPDDDAAAGAIDLFESLAVQMSPRRDDHPADIEFIAGELVGLVRRIADDEPMPDGDLTTRPSELMGEGPLGSAEEMMTAALDVLTETQRFRPEARYIDCIRPCLPFCTPDFRPELEYRLAELEATVGQPNWAGAVWNASAVGGWHGFDDLGDLSSIGVELNWPGDWPNLVLFGLVAIEHGPFAQEFVLTALEDYTQEFTPGTPWPADPGEPSCQADVIRHLEPMAAEEAVGRLLDAMDTTERLGAPTADDYFEFAPFARQTLASLPLIDPPDPSPATNEERDEMVRDFLNADGVAFALDFEDDPDFAQQVGEFCELFIDYSERFAGGDLYRWSPMVVEGFLHHYANNIVSNATADDLLERALDQWVQFCHQEKGWPPSVTIESLLAIEEHLGCAFGDIPQQPDAPSQFGADLPAPLRQQLSHLLAELGTDTNDPDSMQELTDTWYANNEWPDDEAAPMPWARVPEEAKARCADVLAIAEPVLEDLFAHFHVTSARRMVADLAVDHTDDLLRGRADVWAAGITYGVAQVHFVFDSRGIGSGVPGTLTPQQLIDAFPSVSKASITSRATKVRNLLDANGPGRARYERFSAAFSLLPYLDRDEVLKPRRDTD